jgi:hypothetical protein
MKFLNEYKSFYKEGDIVLIEYWYNDMITPVKILEKVSSRKFKISHNIPQSEIFNAPDETINTSDIIDNARI